MCLDANLVCIGGRESKFRCVESLVNIKRNEALSALETLGFSVKDINKVLDNILSENPDLSVEQLIKMSLKKL